MTTFASSIKNATLPQLPSLPPLPDPEDHYRRQVELDSAIELNRASTPQSVLDKRTTPRMSIGEMNAMDWDQVRARYEALPRADTRPDIVRFLDLIDLPRNAVANAITAIAMPEARRAAIERGDVDEFGLPKVFGSDILRGLGINNRIVNGVAGFGIDLVMDPISWAFAPLGAVSATTKGGVTLTVGAAGRRALNQGLKSVKKGNMAGIRDDNVRRLLQTTAGAHGIDLASEGAEGALRSALIGDTGGLAKRAFDRVTLSQSGVGGDLAEKGVLGLERVADDAIRVTADEAEHVRAVKDFIQAFQTKGAKIGKDAVVPIAHVPFTTWTLYGPQVGPIGRQMTMQKAFVAARKGQVANAQMLMAAQKSIDEAERLAGEAYDIQKLLEDTTLHGDVDMDAAKAFIGVDDEGDDILSVAIREAEFEKGEALTGVDGAAEALDDTEMLEVVRGELRTAMNNRAAEITEVKDQITAALRARLDGKSPIESIDNVGDIVATSRMIEQLAGRAELLQTKAKWVGEVEDLVPRMTGPDIAAARNARAGLRDEAGIAPDEVFDALDPDRKARFRQLAQVSAEVDRRRFNELLPLDDADLESADRVATAFGKVLSAATDLSYLSGMPVRQLLDADQRSLVRAASAMLGITDEQVGTLRLSSVQNTFRYMHADGIAQMMGSLGDQVTRTFGAAPGPTQLRSLTRILNVIRHGGIDAVRPEVNEYVRRVVSIADKHGVARQDRDKLEMLAVAIGFAKANPDEKVWLKTLKGQDTAMGRALKDAEADGLLNNEKLMAELESLSNDYFQKFAKMGEKSYADRQIDAISGTPYFPLALKEQFARRFIQFKAEALKKTGQNVNESAMLKEFYENNRSLYEIRFRVPDEDTLRQLGKTDSEIEEIAQMTEVLADEGGYISYLDLEREAWRGVPESHLGQFGDETRERIQRLQLKEQLYDAVHPNVAGLDGDAKALARRANHGRDLDPFEASEMMRNGEFGFMYPDGKHGLQMFETSFAHAMATRGAAQHVAEAKAALVNIIKPHILPLELRDEPLSHAMQAGQPFTTKSGLRVTVLKTDGPRASKVRVGDTVYRRLDERLSTDAETMFDMAKIYSDAEQGTAWVPENIYHMVRRFEEETTAEGVATALKIANQVTSAWKTTTLGHPSWSIVNAVGNAFLLMMAHPQLAANPKRLYEYAAFSSKVAATQGDPEKLRALKIVVGGQEINGEDFARLSVSERVMNGGQSADVADQIMRAIGQDNNPFTRAAERTRNLPSRVSQLYREGVDEASVMASATPGQKFKARVQAANRGGIRPVVQTWFRINGGIDDTFRMMSFLAFLERGDDAMDAAAKTRRAMLNFGDLTTTETNVMRSVFPFYSWLRASMPAMLSRMVDDPRYFTVLPKIQESMEELFAGEEALPRHKRPRWIQEQMGIQIGTDEGRKFLTIGTMVPQEQAIRTVTGVAGLAGHAAETASAGLYDAPFDGQSVMDYLDFFLSQQAPWARMATDLGRGEESFTRRKIGPSLEEGDITINEYLLGQVRQLKELGVGSVRQGPLQRSFREGLGSGAGRLLIGGRLQPGADDRILYNLKRDMREKEERIRKAIRLAEREGSEEASVRARASLLRLYAEYLQTGGDPADVPKWAQAQLGELASAVPAS